MDTRMPPLDYIGRLEWRQALEPQASRFDLTMTELPRLDDLVGLTNLRGDDPYGIFNGDARNPARHQPADELEGNYIHDSLTVDNMSQQCAATR